MMKYIIIAGLLFFTSVNAQVNQERDHIIIVGSSTVYPFAKLVGDKFSKNTKFKKPKLESTGSGFGIRLFCSGVGYKYPDITNASRRIKKSEISKCKKNGVSEIIEIKIGYDGIAIARDKGADNIKLKMKDIFLALAKEIPDPKIERKLITNPYKTWKEVNSDLPDLKIKVLGPPPTSGTRDAFEEMVLEGGCKTIPWIKTIKMKNKERYKKICHTIREDGAYIESGENDNLIVQKLTSNPDVMGIFGFSFLNQNSNKIKAAFINGVKPEFNSIANGSYPISRPLYLYVKKAHIDIVPGIRKYLKEFTSNKAFGLDGYLSKYGLIPLEKTERIKYQYK